jgi:hypothetical protein
MGQRIDGSGRCQIMAMQRNWASGILGPTHPDRATIRLMQTDCSIMRCGAKLPVLLLPLFCCVATKLRKLPTNDFGWILPMESTPWGSIAMKKVARVNNALAAPTNSDRTNATLSTSLPPPRTRLRLLLLRMSYQNCLIPPDASLLILPNFARASRTKHMVWTLSGGSNNNRLALLFCCFFFLHQIECAKIFHSCPQRFPCQMPCISLFIGMRPILGQGQKVNQKRGDIPMVRNLHLLMELELRKQ